MKNNYIHSKRQLQHPLPTTGGQWTMFFYLRNILWVKSLKHVKNSANLIFWANYHIINLMVKTIFKKYQDVMDRKFLSNRNNRQMKNNIIHMKRLFKNSKKGKKYNVMHEQNSTIKNAYY